MMASLYTNLEPTLSQIRLLKLEAASSGPSGQSNNTIENSPVVVSHLRYSLEVISLDEKPVFCALSYVWGSTDKMKSILVNDIEVSITQNLHYSLLALAKASFQGYLWVDAVCINQLENDERSSQVRLMSRIYREAEFVCCQLGDIGPIVASYLYFRSSLAAGSKEDWAEMCLKAAQDGLSSLDIKAMAQSILVGQSIFYQLPYFQRMWTLQEVLLPGSRAQFWSGETLLPDSLDPRRHPWLTDPEFIADGWRDLTSIPHHQRTILQNLVIEALEDAGSSSFQYEMFHDMWHKEFVKRENGDKHLEHEFGSSLSLLLGSTIQRLCGEPRDKVFAVLAVLEPIVIDEQAPPLSKVSKLLSQRGRRDYLTINYNKPTERVVRDALFYCHAFESSESIGWISRHYMPRKEALVRKMSPRAADTATYPTWLPDMTRPRSQRPIFMPNWPDEKIAVKEMRWLKEDETKKLSDRLSLNVRPLGRVVEVFRWTNFSDEDVFDLLSYIMCEAWLQSERPGLEELHNALSAKYGIPVIDWLSRQTSSPASLQKIRHLLSMMRTPVRAPGDNVNRKQTATPTIYDWLVSALLKAHDLDVTRPFIGIPWWFAASYELRSLPSDLATFSADQTKKIQQLYRLRTSLLDKEFFVLESGILGLCSDAVKEGDLVAYAKCFFDVLLLREAKSCNNTSEDLHAVESSEDEALETHLLVEYPYINGLDSDDGAVHLIKDVDVPADLQIILG